MKKRFVVAGITAGLISSGAAGIMFGAPITSGAQTSSSSSVTTQETTPVDHSEKLSTVLQPLVDDSTLNDTQRDAVVTRLDEAHTNGELGRGPGGPGGKGGPGGMHQNFDTVASTLGVTVDELHTALQSGKSIADVANEKGVAVQTVIDTLVAEAKTRIDEHIASDPEDAPEAATRLEEATQRITDMVNGVKPADGGMGMGMGKGHGGPRGNTDTADQTAEAQTTNA